MVFNEDQNRMRYAVICLNVYMVDATLKEHKECLERGGII